MSGAYTHITIANEAREHARHAGPRKSTMAALGKHLRFLELGALSPDYPYLSMDRSQGVWADSMHYEHTGKLMRALVAGVHAAPSDTQSKLTAWLLGFASHVATDMTIHPVIELKVGPYLGNETAHRVCEMHQDAYLFPRLNLGPAAFTDHLKTGLATCNAPTDTDALDPDVERVWTAALKGTYAQIASGKTPEPSSWHRGFRRVLKTVTNVNHLFPFARHVGVSLGLTYPRYEDIDHQFTKGLRTPSGTIDLKDLFEMARGNVVEMWKGLDEALVNGRSDSLDRLEDWNLDTGKSVATTKLAFWSTKA